MEIKYKMSTEFDSVEWIREKRDQLVNILFANELNVKDFKNCSTVLNFEDLQNPTLIKKCDQYRKALRMFFSTNDVRSLLDYYYYDKDKKPLLNLIKQILKVYNYKLDRISEYQGNYGGTKLYKSKYTIIKIPDDTHIPQT